MVESIFEKIELIVHSRDKHVVHCANEHICVAFLHSRLNSKFLYHFFIIIQVHAATTVADSCVST